MQLRLTAEGAVPAVPPPGPVLCLPCCAPFLRHGPGAGDKVQRVSKPAFTLTIPLDLKEVREHQSVLPTVSHHSAQWVRALQGRTLLSDGTP